MYYAASEVDPRWWGGDSPDMLDADMRHEFLISQDYWHVPNLGDGECLFDSAGDMDATYRAILTVCAIASFQQFWCMSTTMVWVLIASSV